MSEVRPVAAIQGIDSDMPTYPCYHPWPGFQKAVVRPHKDKIWPFEERKNDAPLFQFTAIVDLPESVSIREQHMPGNGLKRPAMTATGISETVASAESKAWKYYQSVSECNHDFSRHTMSDTDKTILLSGHATCCKCGLYVHDYFMSKLIHSARNAAAKLYENRERVGDTRTVYDLGQQIYERVSWTPIRPLSEWVDVAAASWLYGLYLNRVGLKDSQRQELVNATNKRIVDLAEKVFDPGSDRQAQYLLLCYHAEDIGNFGNRYNEVLLKIKAEEAEKSVAKYGHADENLAKYITSWVGVAKKQVKSRSA